jgi:hypothetical protein
LAVDRFIKEARKSHCQAQYETDIAGAWGKLTKCDYCSYYRDEQSAYGFGWRCLLE